MLRVSSENTKSYLRGYTEISQRVLGSSSEIHRRVLRAFSENIKSFSSVRRIISKVTQTILEGSYAVPEIFLGGT